MTGDGVSMLRMWPQGWRWWGCRCYVCARRGDGTPPALPV